MTRLWWKSLATGALAAGFAVGLARGEDQSRVIGDNESIFVDGTTFNVVAGKPTGDAAVQIGKLGARDLGPGALIFRSGGRLYIVDAPLLLQNGVYVGSERERSNRISIEYVPTDKPELQAIYNLVKERRGLETLQQMFAPFRLPADLKIRAVGCGMVNAWYRREDTGPAVTVCYEYLQMIMNNLPKETTPAGITRDDAIFGQFFYVVVHELGHALFDLYDVPVFGREEDAADQFAAYILLQFDKAQRRRLIGGAAYSFNRYVAAAKQNPKVELPLAAFSSTHGQPEQRFYNLLCAAYGADTEQFAFLVDDQYLPKTRAPNCQKEFYTLSKAVHRGITPHVDRELADKVLSTNWLAQKK